MRKRKGGRGRPKSGTNNSKAPANKEAELSAKLIDAGSPNPDVSILGYTQTGPTSYRVGSTQVCLDGSEDDIQPIFRDSEIILEVECGSNSALMYLSRLCQGSKGLCIEFDGAWISPNDFQMLSGRETAKDWKRSIRHYGRSLKLLINKGILTIHPTACRCDSCRLLTQTNACEPPRKIDQNSTELKKHRKLKVDQSFLEKSEDTDIKSGTKAPFDFESEGSKADSDSSEPRSDSSDSEESLPTFAPNKIVPVTKVDLVQNEIRDEVDTNLNAELDEHESDSEQHLQIVENSVEEKKRVSAVDSEQNIKNNKLSAINSCDGDNNDTDVHDHDGSDLDEQSSDATDDTPLSLLKTSLKQDEPSKQHAVEEVNIKVKNEAKESIEVIKSEEDPVVKDKVIHRSPEKPHGQHRESRLSHIINNLRTSKEKLSPVSSQRNIMNDSVFPTPELVPKTEKLHTPDDTKDDSVTHVKDLEMGEIRRNSSSGTGIDSLPMTPSSMPQPMVPPPYFGVPFDPQYPMLGLSLQHLFAQNLANTYGLNGISLPSTAPTNFQDLQSRTKPGNLKLPAATMTKEEYDKQKTTSPTPSNQQPRFTSSPVGSPTSSKGSAPSLTSTNLSAEKAAVMAKLTEKLAKISEKPPEVIDKTVKNVIKKAKRMQKFEKLHAKLKKNDFVSPISGKTNKEYYRDRSPERQPQRYGDPSLRRDKKQLSSNPPPAHQQTKLSNPNPALLPSPGLPFGYPVSPEMLASMPHLQFPLPSLQMWQSCFPFTMPPPGLETARFTQFFHNLNNGFLGNASLKRSMEESVVDLSSKKQRLSSYSDSFQDSKSEKLVTSLHSISRINSVPNIASSPNHSSRSPESTSSSPFLSNGPQLNSGNSSPVPSSTVYSNKLNLAGHGSAKIISDENDNSIEDAHEYNNGVYKVNGINNNPWSEYDRGMKSSPTECTCEFKNIDDIRTWSIEDVCGFMKKLDGCSPYIDTFRRAGVDGSSLPLLTTDSLTKSLGMKLGPALVLTGAVARKAREISQIVPCSYCRKKIQRG